MTKYDDRLLPVIEADPNGPWHQNDPESDNVWLVTMTFAPDQVEEIIEGEIHEGSLVVELYTHETEDKQSTSGWGRLSVVRGIKEIPDDGTAGPGYLIYLDKATTEEANGERVKANPRVGHRV